MQESNLRKKRYHSCILPNKCIPLRLWSDELINKKLIPDNAPDEEILEKR